MTLLRSLVYGYLGAILGGLVVAVAAVAMPLNVQMEAVVGAASIVGVVFGMLGLMLPWRQAAALALARSGRGQRR